MSNKYIFKFHNIEAIQYLKDNFQECIDFTNGRAELRPYGQDDEEEGIEYSLVIYDDKLTGFIPDHFTVYYSSWIIKDPFGNLYVSDGGELFESLFIKSYED